MKTILITSIGTATSVNLFKLLKEKYRIVATDTNPYGYTAGSMLVDEFIQVPMFDKDDYIGVLNEIIRQYNIDLLIPVHDLEVQMVARNKNRIETKVLVPSVAVIDQLSDKLISTLEAAKLEVPVAEIVKEASSIYGNKEVIKRSKHGVGSRGIAVYKAEEIPTGLLKKSYENEDYLVQEYIDGEEYTVDVASNHDGEPFLIIPRRRKEVKAGVATKVEIIRDEMLIEYTKKIVQHYKLPAFSNVQFIKKDGRYYFIECNYRYGGMSVASAMASYNYVEAVMDNLLQGTPLPKGINQFPIKWNAIVTRYYEEQIYEA